MNMFTTFILLTVYYSHLIVVAKEIILNERLPENWCEMFGEEKCPYDDQYCFSKRGWGGSEACEYCPSGGTAWECNIFARKTNYERCNNSSHKYYHKELVACTWRDNCPSSSNISRRKYEEGCNESNCKEKTFGNRPHKCPKDSRCVFRKDSECNICTSEKGGDEATCTDAYCSSLNLTEFDRSEFGLDHKYMRCTRTPKCILKGQWCNGIPDCPEMEDEENCYKEDCKKLNKQYCPGEGRCIEKSLACSDSLYAIFSRNKCKLNMDCIEMCLEKEGHFFCPHSSPSTSKAKWMDDNCLRLNQQCNKPDRSLMEIFDLKEKLWQCSNESEQYIPNEKVCDGIFDCSLNEDESENTCKSFPITMAISYSAAIVCGIVTVMICLKSFNFVTHIFMCAECIKDDSYCLENEQWTKIRRLLILLMGEECKEFVSSSNVNDFMYSNWKEQQQAYHDVHQHESQIIGMKSIFKYLNYRFEQKVTFENLTRVMNQKQTIYEKVYTFEIQCHGGNEHNALKCMFENQGGNVVDLKEAPTIFTRANLLFTVISKNIFECSIVLPTIKMMFFVFDLTKDVAFAAYLTRILFDEESQDRISTDDHYLFGMYVTSLILGQILLSTFCFLHRYKAVSLCSHKESRSSRIVISTIMIVFFPVTGIIMSTNSYMDERLVKDQFQKIGNGSPTSEQEERSHDQIDWSLGPITKSEYEQIVTQVNYTEKQTSLGGFELMKMVESLIESYLQILVILVIFNQLPQEGMLNESIFSFSTVNEEETFVGMVNLTARDIFIITSIMSYFFIATGVVSFINILEDGSMTFKEKIFLIVIYLIRVGTSLATSTVLLLMKSNAHPNIGFLLWVSIAGMKFMLLSALTAMTMGRKKLEFKTLLLLAANLNIPVQMQKFIQLSSKDAPKLDISVLLVWILCAMESCSRLICTYSYSSEEVFKTFSPFNIQSYICLIILLEFAIFSLWYLFFRKLYLWRNLIISKPGRMQRDHLTQEEGLIENVVAMQQETQSTEFFEMDAIATQNTREDNEKDVQKLKRSETFAFINKADFPNTQFHIRKNSCPPSLNLNKVSPQDLEDLKHELTSYSIDSAEGNPEPMLKPKYPFIQKLLDAFIGSVFIFLLVLCIISVSTNVLRPTQSKYRDCYDVNIKQMKKDGFYTLTLNNKPVYSYCYNGSTLIQQRNPFRGNNMNYFERSLTNYEDGFGFVEKEMFLGLRNIYELNKNNNTVLLIEATKQDDGSKILIEFDQFIILKEAVDSETYRMPFPQKRNQKEFYPIISLGNQSSYGVEGGQFIFIHPVYLKRLNQKKKARPKLKWYHDLHYTSFSSFDSETNYECGRDWRGGWWYPYGIKYDNGRFFVKEECQYNKSKPISNLNGIFNDNIEENERQLVLCLKENLEECIEIEKQSEWGVEYISGWHLTNTRTIKLTETKMWLKRSESGVGYEISEKIQSCLSWWCPN